MTSTSTTTSTTASTSHPDSPARFASARLARFPSLQAQRVFITGGGTGIGAAMVAAFAEQGAQVAFVDFAEAPSRALVSHIAAAGHAKPWYRLCDVRDIAALQTAVADAIAALGDFATLINNVARDDRHTLESVTPQYWEERMAVNQRPAFFAIQAIVPGMKRLGGGSIINLGSTGWQTKGSAYPCYAIAKSSINGLTRG
ncbi:MAG: SDR family NAD(P)-dependent oxidoreductase, partial [Rhodoferax sp.]|nr:SDR family NAD(P)-dependent oxidoreductase [Rhodoferax sp.]